MPFILILVAGLLIMAAWNNSAGSLMTELETDVPGFAKWFVAIAAVGALGWIPGVEKISKWLLGLVLLVLVLKNYTNIIAGFQALSGASTTTTTAGMTNPTPADAYIANPNNPQITQAEIAGTGSSSAQAVNINAAGQVPQAQSPYGAFDPAAFLADFAMGYGGFGGVV